MRAINRAERMNALNEEVILGLQAAWQRLETSDDRDELDILTACAGDKAFSVGADVKDAPKTRCGSAGVDGQALGHALVRRRASRL